jgi:hypothetical protein
VEAFDETGKTHPHPAVTIKQFTVLVYTADDALEYAREHLPQALKLDKHVFERVAKAAQPPFVLFTKEPRATIARDLSEYVTDKTALPVSS